MATAPTLYERAGGDAFFEELTRRFYEGVATDPVLRPLYPDEQAGLDAARDHLCAFLIQYWGGPSIYNEQRGRPALQMRHLPFAIGETERDAWVRHMTGAVRASGLGGLDEIRMITYFESAAAHLVNQPEGGSEPSE